MKQPPQDKKSTSPHQKQTQRSGFVKIIFLVVALGLLFIGGCLLGGALYFQHYLMTPANATRSLFNLPTLTATFNAVVDRLSPDMDKAGDMKMASKKEMETLLSSPRPSATSESIPFFIQRGESVIHIAKRLENKGLTTNRHLFRLMAMGKGADKKLQAGEYLLSPSFTPEEILYLLVNGKVRLYKLTLPEGLTLNEMGPLVARAGFGNAEAFIALASDMGTIKDMTTDIISSVGFGKSPHINTLEGYLFPDTYLFPSQTSHQKILTTMVSRFKEIISPDWQMRGKALGLSLHEVVTLASIIEKETGAAHERPLIASVFHNRLKKGMRLQSDPTVIYGIPNFNGNITRKDLRRPTPYNTYTITGLPPGPIANPGKAAIHAALFPEKSDYLYFVAKKDGTHFFSKTLKAHNRAVRKYQLSQGKK